VDSRLLRNGTLKPYRTSYEHRLVVKERRDRLRAARLCINGEQHGKATRGTRCEQCAEARKS
jgi:hypothetical protein